MKILLESQSTHAQAIPFNLPMNFALMLKLYVIVYTGQAVIHIGNLISRKTGLVLQQKRVSVVPVVRTQTISLEKMPVMMQSR